MGERHAAGLGTARDSLWLLMGGIATVGIQALMLSPMLTDIMAALRIGAAQVGIAAGAYGFGVAVSALLTAPRLDSWPRRLALQISFAVMALALALCATAWDWRVLVAGQFVIGGTAGVIIPASYALTSDLAPDAMRTQALGRVVLGWSVALCAGVPLAALITDALGWRGTFLAVAGLALATSLAFLALPKPQRRELGGRVPYFHALAAPRTGWLLVGTLAFMLAFYGAYSFIGDHLRSIHGTGAWLGGVLAMSYGAGYGITVLADGWIDRQGPLTIVAPALGFVGLQYVVMPFTTGSIAMVLVFAFVWGVINHFSMTSLVSSLSQAPAAVRGAVLSLFSAVTYFAQGLAGALMGVIYGAYGFPAVSWLAAAGAFLAAAALWLALGNRRA